MVVNFDSSTTPQMVIGYISSFVDGTINAIDTLNNNGLITSVPVTVGGSTTMVTCSLDLFLSHDGFEDAEKALIKDQGQCCRLFISQ